MLLVSSTFNLQSLGPGNCRSKGKARIKRVHQRLVIEISSKAEEECGEEREVGSVSNHVWSLRKSIGGRPRGVIKLGQLGNDQVTLLLYLHLF